jgi:hypothetical protein
MRYIHRELEKELVRAPRNFPALVMPSQYRELD